MMERSQQQRRVDFPERNAAGYASAAASIAIVIEQLTGFVRRQYPVFAVVISAAVALGLLYLLITPPQYSATASLLIDSSKLQVLQNQLQPLNDKPVDTSQVESQVELLRSDGIALSVIKQLSLSENPEFVGSGRGLLGEIVALFSFGAAEADSKTEKEQRALSVFLKNRRVSRVGRTYVLDITYTSRSPASAAAIANAIADAYIDDQLEAKYQTTRRASAWLQDRINELKAQATSADRAVLEFKEKKNIVDFGGTSGANSQGPSTRLIGEQQLFELNSQLVTARLATSEARARLERIEQVQKLDVREATVADTLKNDVITRLRNQYLDLAAREANLSGRYGREHLAPSNLRDQMEELRRNIGEELSRIAASYKSDYEIAKTRQESLEQSLTNLVSEGRLTNRDRLGLSELESAAKVYHGIYNNFLQRYMEAIQQQSFPITDARVISQATAPTRKSKPEGLLVLAISLAAGTIASFGMAVVRESTDGVFRTAQQVEDALNTKCLALIPLVKPAGAEAFESAPPLIRQALRHANTWRVRQSPMTSTATWKMTSDATAAALSREAVDQPFSQFAESIRAIKISIEREARAHGSRVIGVTSAMPGEGKSTTAFNLAQLMADTGKRVILIDTDLHRPTLAQNLDPKPTAGLIEVLTEKADLQHVLAYDKATGLSLLPLVLEKRIVHSDELLSSRGFRDLMEQLRQRYDYIIVDLPPIAPVVDVRAIAPLIDSFIFVVEWGATKIKPVRRLVAAHAELHDRLLGVVLNKTDLKVLKRFEEQDLYQGAYSYYRNVETSRREPIA